MKGVLDATEAIMEVLRNLAEGDKEFQELLDQIHKEQMEILQRDYQEKLAVIQLSSAEFFGNA